MEKRGVNIFLEDILQGFEDKEEIGRKENSLDYEKDKKVALYNSHIRFYFM